MRKIILAAAVSAAGLVAVAAPAFAITSYQIQGDQAANFQDPDSKPSSNFGGLNVTSTTSTDDQSGFGVNGGPINNYTSTPVRNQDLSRDMNWQGTGYYLRPSN